MPILPSLISRALSFPFTYLSSLLAATTLELINVGGTKGGQGSERRPYMLGTRASPHTIGTLRQPVPSTSPQLSTRFVGQRSRSISEARHPARESVTPPRSHLHCGTLARQPLVDIGTSRSTVMSAYATLVVV